MTFAMRGRYASSDDAFIVANTPPKNSGNGCVRKVTRVTTPNPPPPPFRAQNRSGFEQALAILISPSAVPTSASNGLAPARPKAFDQLPKPPPRTSPATPTVMQPPPCT